MTRINLSGRAAAAFPGRTATAIGSLVSGLLGGRRTEQPVRRDSYDVDDPRVRLFWGPLPKWFKRRQLDAAEAYERSTRQPGCQNGALGRVGLEVLRALHGFVNWKTGALYPSLLQIAAKIWRSKNAVSQALARLAENGFVEWIRRSERIEDAEGAGPRVKQASNAYRLIAPRELLRAHLAVVPLPPDEEERRRVEQAATAEMVHGLDPADYVALSIADPGLREALLALGRAMSASHPAGQNPT